jgi:hypothetical protein
MLQIKSYQKNAHGHWAQEWTLAKLAEKLISLQVDIQSDREAYKERGVNIHEQVARTSAKNIFENFRMLITVTNDESRMFIIIRCEDD